MKGLICITPGCGRRPPNNQVLCGTCQRAVSAGTKLALEGHSDAIANCHRWGVPNQQNNSERVAWMGYVTWSRDRTIEAAALEAWEARDDLPADRPTLEHAVRLRERVEAILR